MHGSESKDGQHSTPDEDNRSRFFPRVIFSLAVFGLLIGLMIGRLTAPDPSHLVQIEEQPGALVLWFDHEPKLHGELVDGTVALLFDAEGRAGKGQITLGERPVTWRVQDTDKGLLVNLVAARPLRGDWAGAEEGGRWRLRVNLREE